MKMVAPLEVGLNVRDLSRMRAFYETVLGLEFVNEIKVPAAKARQAALSNQGYVVVRLQASGGERLKLLAPQTPAGAAPQPPFILDQPGSSYITFIIDDIRSACGRVSANGIQFMTGPEPIEVRPGTWLAFFRDPEGHIVELVQYDDIAAYRPDLSSAA